MSRPPFLPLLWPQETDVRKSVRTAQQRGPRLTSSSSFPLLSTLIYPLLPHSFYAVLYCTLLYCATYCSVFEVVLSKSRERRSERARKGRGGRGPFLLVNVVQTDGRTDGKLVQEKGEGEEGPRPFSAPREVQYIGSRRNRLTYVRILVQAGPTDRAHASSCTAANSTGAQEERWIYLRTYTYVERMDKVTK